MKAAREMKKLKRIMLTLDTVWVTCYRPTSGSAVTMWITYRSPLVQLKTRMTFSSKELEIINWMSCYYRRWESIGQFVPKTINFGSALRTILERAMPKEFAATTVEMKQGPDIKLVEQASLLMARWHITLWELDLTKHNLGGGLGPDTEEKEGLFSDV